MKKKQRSLWSRWCWWAAAPSGRSPVPTGTRPVLGLDLEGGVSVILSAPDGTPEP
jgi:hypothetical protein